MTMKYPDCNRQKKDSQGCTDWGKESRVVLEGKQSQGARFMSVHPENLFWCLSRRKKKHSEPARSVLKGQAVTQNIATRGLISSIKKSTLKSQELSKGLF